MMLSLLVTVCACIAEVPSIEYIQTSSLSTSAIDQRGSTFTVTGLSGIAWSKADQWFAVMDNSDKVVQIQVLISEDGSIDAKIVAGLTLSRSGDYEDIAICGDGSLLLIDEQSQEMHRFDPMSGDLLASYLLPEIYQTRRDNLGCESLSSQGATSWLANEEALEGDGSVATPERTTAVRLLHQVVANESDCEQFFYVVDAMHGPDLPFVGGGRSGLCAIVQLPNHQLLAMERSFAFNDNIFVSKMYVVDYSNATDVSHHKQFTTRVVPVTKWLLYQGSHQNMEGLGLGPALNNRANLLLGVVDNGDPLSKNSVVVFKIRDFARCTADIDNDGDVDVLDLRLLIDAWGVSNWVGCKQDLDENGVVDADDLMQLIRNWGVCS